MIDQSRQLFIVFVAAVVGGYVVIVSRLHPFTPVEGVATVAIAALGLLLVRGTWLLMNSGDARIEQKRAAVRAREGRGPDPEMTYEQELEAQAIAYLSKIPLLRRVVGAFK